MSNPNPHPDVRPAIADRIDDDRHSMRRVIVHAAFLPQAGGSLPVDVYVDVRVVGDGHAPAFQQFAANTLGTFLQRAEECGFVEHAADLSRPPPGVIVHMIDGRSKVLNHLAKSALGAVSFISATEAMTFIGVGKTTGMPDGWRTFNCVTVLPEAVATELADLVNKFMAERGCVSEHDPDQPKP